MSNDMLVFALSCHMTYIFQKCSSKNFKTNPSNSGPRFQPCITFMLILFDNISVLFKSYLNYACLSSSLCLMFVPYQRLYIAFVPISKLKSFEYIVKCLKTLSLLLLHLNSFIESLSTFQDTFCQLGTLIVAPFVTSN